MAFYLFLTDRYGMGAFGYLPRLLEAHTGKFGRVLFDSLDPYNRVSDPNLASKQEHRSIPNAETSRDSR